MGKHSTRAQFSTKPGNEHYLTWRKRVVAEFPGGRVLLGLPGWSAVSQLSLHNGVLTAPPRFLAAAETSPYFADFLRTAASKGYVCPVIYLKPDGTLTVAELSRLVFEHCIAADSSPDTPEHSLCLYRFAGQKGIDSASRERRADSSNYLLASGSTLPDGGVAWRASFDRKAAEFNTPAGATYREQVRASFAEFPDSVHGYANVMHFDYL